MKEFERKRGPKYGASSSRSSFYPHKRDEIQNKPRPQSNRSINSPPHMPGPYEARVNIFELTLSNSLLKEIQLYTHRVNIKHDFKSELNLKEEFKHYLVEIFSKTIDNLFFVYDGDNTLISNIKIHQTEFHHSFYTLDIMFTSKIIIYENNQFTPSFMYFLQLYINKASTSLRWMQLLKSRFFYDSNEFWNNSITTNFNLWYGIRQNLIAYLDSNGKFKLGVTRDITGILGISETTLLKLFKELIKSKYAANEIPSLNSSESSIKFIEKYRNFLNSELKGRSLHIETIHNYPSRKFKFKELMGFLADSNETIFKDKEDTERTVYQYFCKRYPEANVQFFDLIINVGTSRKPIYLPLNLCKVPAQRITGLSKIQKEDLIKNLALPPQRRIQLISSGNEKMNIKNFGPIKLTNSPQFQRVKGEILLHPNLLYNKVVDTNGRATWNLRDVKFLNPCEKSKVLFIHLEDRYDRYVEKDFLSAMANYNIYLTSVSSEIASSYRRETFNEEKLISINEKYYNRNIKIAVIFIPIVYPQDIKDKLKEIMDPYYPSQCLCMETIAKNKRSMASYWANIALKVNLKLGGQNMKIHDMSGSGASFRQIIGSDLSTLIIGADVTYFGNKTLAPSLVSIVGSLDDSLTIYEYYSEAQSPKTEIIENFDDAINQIYNARSKRGIKHPPRRVIYMRDGVSESQMEQIAYHELPRIEKSLSNLAGNNKIPDLLCIVAVKRHGKRFFAPNSDQSPPPGFAVLNDLNHISPWDTFFLQAHTGSIGTLSCTRYFIIRNDLQLSKPKIASFVNCLCYLWPRSTSAISIPSPIMCADIAASRTRGSLRSFILKNKRFDIDNTQSDRITSDSNYLVNYSNETFKKWKNFPPMYFM